MGLVATVGAFVAFSGTANAELLWYDGFEIVAPDDGAGPGYSAGVLAGQQGGSGLGPGGIGPGFFDDALGDPNPWLGVNNVDSSADDSGISAGSLTHPQQINPSTGDKTDGGPSVFGCCYTSRTSRDMNTPMQELSGTYYMSFLVNFGQGNDSDPHYRAIEFWNGKNPVNPDDGSENDGRVGDSVLSMSLGFSSFGNYNDAVNQGLDPNPNTQLSFMVNGVREPFELPETTVHQFEEHLEYDDQNGHYNAGTPPINFDSKTHCIVMRFDLTTDSVEFGETIEGDRVRIYLNPTSTDENDLTPSIDVSGLDLLVDSMSSLIMFAFTGEVPNPGAMDELYVGTEFGDVVCCDVPEPATLALVGFGALGLVMFVRRKAS